MNDPTELDFLPEREIFVEQGGEDALTNRRLSAIADDLRARTPSKSVFGEEIGRIIRAAVDYVVDSPAMRRYAIDELEPDEKTAIGKRIERLIRMRFELPKGQRLDVTLAGEDVDIKTSCTAARSWMFSPSNIDRVNLLIAYNEKSARFDLGLVLVTEDILGAGNRDSKRSLIGQKRTRRGLKGDAEVAEGNIRWLLVDVPYPPNFLGHLPREELLKIVAGKSGAARVRNLLSSQLGVPIPRHAIAAVANQKDPPRRSRGNDGARGQLWKSTQILVLSGQFRKDARIALEVTGVRLSRDETMSLRRDDKRLHEHLVAAYLKHHKLGRQGTSES
jgi:hypothetical protein